MATGLTIVLSVSLYTMVDIPPNIRLLSAEENEKKENEGEPGSWYVRWDTLHYCDDDGEWREHELNLNWDDCDAYKRPKIMECEGNMPELYPTGFVCDNPDEHGGKCSVCVAADKAENK
jgi:hypothetical protein